MPWTPEIGRRCESIVCSRDRNAGLCDVVRAGLDDLAVTIRVTLRLMAAPTDLRPFLLLYPDLTTMLKDQRVLIFGNMFDAVHGPVLPAPTGSPSGSSGEAFIR